MSEEKNYVLIDASLRAITPPGLSSPDASISYHHPKVQQLLSQSFSGIFPSSAQTAANSALPRNT